MSNRNICDCVDDMMGNGKPKTKTEFHKLLVGWEESGSNSNTRANCSAVMISYGSQPCSGAVLSRASAHVLLLAAEAIYCLRIWVGLDSAVVVLLLNSEYSFDVPTSMDLMLSQRR